MNNKLYVGIDIGKNGAIATIDPKGEIITYPMPLIGSELDYHELSTLMVKITTDYPEVHVVFEKLGVIFGSGKNVAFSMGEQIGAVEMSCICKGIPYTKTRAILWQKEMFQGVPEQLKTNSSKRDTKSMALIAIKRIFPDLVLTFGKRAVKPHDGLIDAVLMAEYARRKNL